MYTKIIEWPDMTCVPEKGGAKLSFIVKAVKTH